MTGRTSAASIESSASTVATRIPELPRASALARRTIIARTARSVERTPDAGGVAPDQVALERFELIPRNRDVGELAESRRHAVDLAGFTDRPVDDAAGGGDGAAGRGSQRRPSLPVRHRRQVV